MSWEAVAWANRQRLRLPQEQLVLLVLANCADPDGCAFARWRGREHWWTYIKERTRLSKSSVFRHLKTIEALGLGQRTELELADGSSRPVIHLDLEKIVDVQADEHDEIAGAEGANAQSHSETGNLPDQSHGETGASLTVRPDQSHGETGHSIDLTRDSNRGSIPPNPPTGGGQVVDQEFEDQIAEAGKTYPIPITNLPRFRAVWQAQDRAARPKILAAMRAFAGFIADCERKGKPRGVKDADRWVAAGMWQGYVQSAENADAAAAIVHLPVGSKGANAWGVLHKIADLEPPTPSNGLVMLKRPLSPRELAFADAPDDADWCFVPETEANKVGAWRSFLGTELDKPLGRLIRERSWRKLKPEEVEAHGGRSTEIINQRGFLAPWPWPPRKDGSLSTTGPPDTLMTDQDVKDLDQLGKMTG
jgi:hypothetical protein